MNFLLENIWRYGIMLVLLVISAAFSATETALFRLTKHQKDKMRASEHKIDNIIASLLSIPGKLLTVLLFGNLLINVFFFSLSGMISISLAHNGYQLGATLQGAASLTILVLFGEMLPKSIAYSHSIAVAKLTALPILVLVKTTAPLLNVFNLLIIVPAIRIFTPMIPQKRQITTDHLKLLVNETAKSEIDAQASSILNEIIDMRDRKVRDIMRHRIDMICANVNTSIDKAIEIMTANRIKKLPVYKKNADHIIGMVHIRSLLTSGHKSLSEAVTPILFVPEQKKVDSLLDLFQKSHKDIAVVVDEYGGISGLITIKDIIYEIIGSGRADVYGIIQQIGPMSYRLGGDLPVHDWLDIIGINTEEIKYTTIGGFVMAILGKIPAVGEVAKYENITFRIESMDKRRVKTIIVEMN